MAGVARSIEPRTEPTQNVPLQAFLLYFLRLGKFGFGGPIALAGNMRHDLVDNRNQPRYIARCAASGPGTTVRTPGPRCNPRN